MDWSHIITAAVSVLAAAIVSLGGSYFWFRRNLNRIHNEENANAVAGWRELMEYKSKDFQNKNAEQDARAAAMRKELDEMHAAHLKCEREGLAREILLRQEAADREIKLKELEARIKELSSQVEALQATLTKEPKNA